MGNENRTIRYRVTGDNITLIDGDQVMTWPWNHPKSMPLLSALRDELPDADVRILCRTAIATPRHNRNYEVRLALNPSARARAELSAFIARWPDISVDPEGYVLAYKYVREDYRDQYTGTVDNRPGCCPRMPRRDCDDDAGKACSTGFHVGSMHYIGMSGARLMQVRFSPEDVVSICRDAEVGKLRVCGYEVLQEVTIPRSDVPGAPENVANKVAREQAAVNAWRDAVLEFAEYEMARQRKRDTVATPTVETVPTSPWRQLFGWMFP